MAGSTKLGTIVPFATGLMVIFTVHVTEAGLQVKRQVDGERQASKFLRKEIILTANGAAGCPDWSGKRESTCDTFKSIDDLSASGCASAEYSQVIRNGLNGSVTNDIGVWCPCGSQPCSMIFRITNESKVAQVIVSAWVDSNAEVLVLAEFSVEQGELFQIGKLHAKPKSHDGLERVQFDYYKEDYLDMSEINVTMVKNGGFALMDTFIVVLEESKPTSTTALPPAAQELSLDIRDDLNRKEWIQADCHYSDYYEDFWTFGCPINADSNYLPPSIGFWYPCHMKSCSFIYDGTNEGHVDGVTIQGHFQGGELLISGKQHALDEVSWKPLGAYKFHNITKTTADFDLTSVCGIKVLLVTVIADTANVILVDKIHIRNKPIGSNHECQPLKEQAAATDNCAKPSAHITMMASICITLHLLIPALHLLMFC